MPLTLPGGEFDRQTRDLHVVRRTKPGVAAVEVREEMRMLASRPGIAPDEQAMERAQPKSSTRGRPRRSI